MDNESGFFDEDVARDVINSNYDSLTDLRLIYQSRKGFSKIFVAKKNGRLFVIKCLKPEICNDNVALAALRKEYDVSFLIDSPYVARTFDYICRDETGHAILMEFCPGKSLGAIIREKETLSDQEVQTILLGLVKGVQAIHAAGTVHRDIKPDNVIFDNTTHSVKIIDFGCADSKSFTIFNGAAGTPGYAAPHMLENDYRTSVADDYHALAMTFSDLKSICSPKSQKILSSLSEKLLSGQTIVADDIKHRFQQSKKTWIKPTIVVASAVISLIAAFFIYWGITRSDTPIETPNDSPIETSNDSLPANNDIPPVKAETPDTNPDIDERPTPPSQKDESAVAPIAPEKQFDDVNGVRYEEAKYARYFRQNEFDKIVVIYVDSYMSTNYLQMHNRRISEEARDSANVAFKSFVGLWEEVHPKIVSKYGTENISRAIGLARQRQLYWLEENYVPEPLLLFLGMNGEGD